MRRVLVPLVVLAWAATVGPATAQSTDPRLRVVVASMSGVVGPGAAEHLGDDIGLRLLVENVGETAVDDVTVLVEVFAATGSRSALHAAVDEGEPEGLLEDLRTEVPEPIAPGDVAALVVEVPGDTIGWAGTGVHPLRISALRGRTLLDGVDTAVVRLERPPSERVSTLLGWPLDAAPGAAADVTAPGSRIDALVRALEGAAPVAQALVGPHLVEDLARQPDATLLERLRALADEGVTFVPGVYADADLAGLVAEGLPTEAIQHLTEGQRQAERGLQVALPADAFWSGAARLSPAALSQALVPARVRHLVVRWDALAEGRDEPPVETPPPTRSLRAGGTQIVAAVGDPWLTDLLADLDDPHGSAVAVQRIVAETAMVHLERPNAPGRGVVLLPPPDWDPDPRAARALAQWLPRLPWLEVTDLQGLLEAVPSSPTAVLAEDDGATVDAELAERIRVLRERMSSLRAALPSSPAAVGGHRWEELDDRILRAPSTWPIRRNAYLDEVEEAVHAGYGQVSLPDEAVVTLTAREGTVPVTITRAEGGPIELAISLDAPPRLRFPEGDVQLVTVGEGATTTIAFPVEARGAGRIPVTVRVGDPSGTVELARSTLVVRSTALSAPALAVLGGVLALLVAWWIVRRLRPPRPPLQVVRDEAA